MDIEKLKQANLIFADLLGKSVEDALSALKTYNHVDQDILELVKNLITNSAQSNTFFEQKVGQHFYHKNINDWKPGMIIGKYELMDKIGEGGMSLVFKAQRLEHQTQKPVAIKIFKLEAQSKQIKAQFQAEQRILADLTHPNIINFQHGEDNSQGNAYIVMELIEQGLTIDEYVKQHQLNNRSIIQLIQQVAAGLQHAHNLLVIHRDIKPSNLMVDANGQLKILDFGIAKILKDQLPAHKKSSSEPDKQTLLALTPSYAAPEQINAKRSDVRTDVYSLAAVTLYLLTGQQPFPADRLLKGCHDDENHVQNIINNFIKNRDLRNLLNKALKTSPDERYTNMFSFAEDLKAWVNNKPISATADSWWYRLQRFASRQPALLSTSAALVMTVLVAMIILSLQNISIKKEAQKAQAVKNFMLDAFSVSDPNTAKGIDLSSKDLLQLAAIRIEQTRDMDESIKFELYESMAIANAKLGHYPEAIKLTNKALQIEPENERVTTQLIEYLFQAGQIKTVNELLEKINESKFTSQEYEADVMRVRINLLSQAGSHDKAFDQYRQFNKRFNDDKHHFKNQTLLAEMYFLKGESSKSVQIIEALKNEIDLPEDDVKMMGLNSDLVQYYDQAGDFSSARRLIEQNIQSYRRILGDEHPQVGMAYNNLSLFQRLEGQLDTALDSAKISESIYRKRYGHQSEGLAQALSNQGTALFYQGKNDTAIELMQQSVLILTDIFGPKHPETMDAKANLAVVLNASGQPKKALPILIETFEHEKATLGQSNIATIYTQMALALALANSQEYDMAINHATDIIQLTQQHHSDNHDNVNHAHSIAGRVYYMAQNHTKALEHNQIHIKTWQQGNEINLAQSFNLVAQSHQALGNHEAAKKHLYEWTQRLKKIHGETGEQYLNGVLNMASRLDQMNDPIEANHWTQEVLTIMKDSNLEYESTLNLLKDLEMSP